METSNYLYDIKPNEYEAYADMIMKDLEDFIHFHILNETNKAKQEKNLNWLLNWIGKDCYQHLRNKNPFITSPEKKECEDRRDFIKNVYSKKSETKPFMDVKESNTYLRENKNNPDAGFVSRLSSTVPGELTIQYIDDDKDSAFARRFNYKTQKSTSGPIVSIDEFLKEILEKKNLAFQKRNQEKIYDTTKVKNYYSKPPISVETPKSKGHYLQPGEFTKKHQLNEMFDLLQ